VINGPHNNLIMDTLKFSVLSITSLLRVWKEDLHVTGVTVLEVFLSV